MDREDELYKMLDLAISQIGQGLELLGFDTRRLVPPDSTTEEAAAYALICAGRANVAYAVSYAALLHLEHENIAVRWPDALGVGDAIKKENRESNRNCGEG